MKKFEYGLNKTKKDLAIREYKPGIPSDFMRILAENSDQLDDNQL